MREFHERFALTVRDQPTVPPVSESRLRLRLIVEELVELACALHGLRESDGAADRMMAALDVELTCAVGDGNADLTAVAAELADLLYVANGAAMHVGIDPDAAVEAKHRSNLSKLGPDGRPVLRADGKVLKGEKFCPPDFSAVLGR